MMAPWTAPEFLSAPKRRRPIDLLGTPAGVEMVEDLLGRIEYGVYV